MDKVSQTSGQWVAQKERGSPWTIDFMVWLCRHKFRWLVNALLYPIVAYFFITAGNTRQASQQFFQRATGQHSWLDHYKQLMCFAKSLVDRVLILMGEADQFKVVPHGREMLIEEKEKGRGLILLGAHLGNFEACKILVKHRANIDVYIVAYFGASKKIRSALDSIDPDMANKIIDPTDPDAVFKMRDVVENGGILAILGDRTGIGEKKLPVEFMGKTAYLPAGPYYMASILRCPIYCFFGLRVDDNTYDSYVLKLADQIKLSRRHRQEEAQQYAQQYADLLSEKARQYPYNWFNFFDYWDSDSNRDNA